MPSTFKHLHDTFQDRLYAADGDGVSETFQVSELLEDRELGELCRRIERIFPDFTIEASQQITLTAKPKGVST
jgi:hypothetical protein